MSITYRREIDGLRAIAVSAVVLYHAGLAPAAGYLGVDIFFVISGYLITALLLREHDKTGRIDLADFYARRVRRIFPAGIAIILAVLLAAALLPAIARQGVIESASAAAIFGANIYFQLATDGYFTGDAGQYPLLHLWSLSVEEQFYLVWPALLIVLLRFRVRLVPALATLAIASFLLTEWLMRGNPSAAFYQMPARFWELAAGGLIAALPARALPSWAAWVGLAVTVVACFVPLPHFPGIGALPAVAGAALLLAAINGGATNALLASRPFVGVGLISYSLYLWHWPLLAFDRLLRIGPSPLETRLALVAAALVLAFASYRYIETPLRKPWGSSRRTVAAGFAMMATLACGAWAWREPAPVAPPVVWVAKCFPFSPADPPRIQNPKCFSTEAKVVLWGDSTAHAWSPMGQAIGARLQLPVTTFALDGCPPIAGVRTGLRSNGEAEACRAWNAKAIAYLVRNGADTVVLSARWKNFLPDGQAGLADSIAAIAPHVRRILLVGPTPTLPDEPAKCAALGSDCALARSQFEEEAGRAWSTIRGIDEPKVTVVDPAAWLCDAKSCGAFRDGRALYDDRFHVSRSAAAEFGQRIALGWN